MVAAAPKPSPPAAAVVFAAGAPKLRAGAAEVGAAAAPNPVNPAADVAVVAAAAGGAPRLKLVLVAGEAPKEENPAAGAAADTAGGAPSVNPMIVRLSRLSIFLGLSHES